MNRPVARVIVIDDQDRVLLFDTQLAYTRVWMSPGGAVEPGETFEAAAVRELWEETGLSGVSLSRCIWRVCFSFRHQGVVYDQDERYFATRVPAFGVSGSNLQPYEMTEIRATRWWTLPEISSSSSSFRPAGLATLLPAILRGDYPGEPLLARVEDCALILSGA